MTVLYFIQLVTVCLVISFTIVTTIKDNSAPFDQAYARVILIGISWVVLALVMML